MDWVCVCSDVSHLFEVIKPFHHFICLLLQRDLSSPEGVRPSPCLAKILFLLGVRESLLHNCGDVLFVRRVFSNKPTVFIRKLFEDAILERRKATRRRRGGRLHSGHGHGRRC